jgi:hypothetical protein
METLIGGLAGIVIGVLIICIVFGIAYFRQTRRFKRDEAEMLERAYMRFDAIEKKHTTPRDVMRTSHRANLVNGYQPVKTDVKLVPPGDE